MEKLIIPLSKSNWPEGRVGPREMQDGYRVQLFGLALLRTSGPECRVLLLSGLNPRGSEKSELAYMREPYLEAKIPSYLTLCQEDGHDTASQVEIGLKAAEMLGMQPHFISAFFHFPRVAWIIWRSKLPKQNVQHSFVLGIPRPMEMMADIVLTFLYPAIDLLGYAKHFNAWVLKRRNSGKL